jgi:hypothetical protein
LCGRQSKAIEEQQYDNTLAHADDNIDKIVETLEKDSLALIEWFSCNQMKTNPDKFQALSYWQKING